MKTKNWTRAWMFASVIASGVVLFSQGASSQADDTKGDKKAAHKVDIKPEPGFGSLVGQFVLDGAIPELPPAATPADGNGADIKTCGADSVPNEKLVVDSKSKGIANIFIYLQKAPAKVHPSLKKSAQPVIEFDQKICQFLPRALLVRVDQTVNVKSADPFPHNTHSHPLRNDEKNVTIPAMDRAGANFEFKVSEKLPISVGCDIHRWMVSHWLILDHPYAALTDAEGKFAIGKLPAGDYEFTVWHESVGYIDRKFKVTIPDNGTADKKVVKVSVDKFKLK